MNQEKLATDLFNDGNDICLKAFELLAQASDKYPPEVHGKLVFVTILRMVDMVRIANSQAAAEEISDGIRDFLQSTKEPFERLKKLMEHFDTNEPDITQH